MNRSHDELAGIVDLFGGLSESEIIEAVQELRFREGTEIESAAIRKSIEQARADFALLPVEAEDEEILVVGPSAFPMLPEGAEDLPHILDVPRRSIPQKHLEEAVRKQLATRVMDDPSPVEAAQLLDVTYDAEAWAGIDLSDVRSRLEDLAEDSP